MNFTLFFPNIGKIRVATNIQSVLHLKIKVAPLLSAFGAVQNNPLNVHAPTGLINGFNGKRLDAEWNSGGAIYDYGFRIYDARLGKFLSVDPLFSGYPWWTPYQYAGNIPNVVNDVDGMEAGDGVTLP